MHVLLVSTTFPHDPGRMVHGVYNRLALLVDGLKRIGHLDCLFYVDREIDVSAGSTVAYRHRLEEHWGTELALALVHRREPSEGAGRWEMYGPPMLDGFGQPKFRLATDEPQAAAFDEALRRNPDVVLAHRLPAMAPVLKSHARLPPVVFDLDDIEHLAFARGISQPPRWPAKRLKYLQVPALWWAERRSIQLAARTFVCSEKDRRYLERTMRASGVTVISNAVEPREPKPLPEHPSALFVGSLSYGPNQVAAGLLVEEIWPKVRRAVPDATLTIAGRYPERVPGYDGPHPGIEFPGFVEDLDGLYERSRVVCVPIRSGGGTRIKVLEAAAFAKPIVATSVGVEGLEMRDEEHYLRRDGVDEFAGAVAELMTNDARCRDLGRGARALVERAYSREQVAQKIGRTVVSTLENAKEPARKPS